MGPAAFGCPNIEFAHKQKRLSKGAGLPKRGSGDTLRELDAVSHRLPFRGALGRVGVGIGHFDQ